MTERRPYDIALSLAARGFRVFPLEEAGKTPLIDNWPIKATADPGVVKSWWRCPVTGWAQPHNIGIATGHGLLVLDVDNKHGRCGDDSLAELELLYDALPETLEVRTPSGGRHLYYTLAAGTVIANSAGKLGAGLDVRGHHGYVVAPGSVTGRGAYTITADRAPAAAPDWLLELCAAATPPKERARDDKPAIAQLDSAAAIERARHYLTHEAPQAVEGDAGDATTYRVAARLKDLGVSEETALDLLLDHWNDEQAPPWPADELHTKVANAYRYGRERAGSADPHAHFTPVLPPAAADIAPQPVLPFEPKSLPRRHWLLGRLALAGKVTVIVAPPGAGKSTLTIAAAVSLASGKPLIGLDVHKRCRVSLYNNEDDLEEMRRRLAAVVQHGGLDFEALSLDGAPALFMNSGEARPLTIAHRVGPDGRIKPADAEALTAQLIARGIECLIVDPFAETHTAGENSNEEILAVARIYRRIAQEANCAVLLVHHTRKRAGASSEGHAGNMDSARGAGALAGVARVMVTLEGMSERDAKEYGVAEADRHLFVRLDDAKANMALVAGKPRWFKRLSVDLASWDVEGVEGAALADETGRPVAVEPVGVLAPVELVKASKDDKPALLARAVAAQFRPGERSLLLREAVRRLAESDPMYADAPEEALVKQLGRILEDSPIWTIDGQLSLAKSGQRGVARRLFLASDEVGQKLDKG